MPGDTPASHQDLPSQLYTPAPGADPDAETHYQLALLRRYPERGPFPEHAMEIVRVMGAVAWAQVPAGAPCQLFLVRDLPAPMWVPRLFFLSDQGEALMQDGAWIDPAAWARPGAPPS